MAEHKKLLILGGTTEARRLADRLAGGSDFGVITSLAGRTSKPTTPAGKLRSGGFGGMKGLCDYLSGEKISWVVDATHPFAATISKTAAEASAALGLPCLRLTRPPWTAQAGDRWISVADSAAAAHRLPELGQRVFLTTGHKDLSAFVGLTDIWFLVRLIEPPARPLPLTNVETIFARGPFDKKSEVALFKAQGIDVLVTKNSGGSATAAKLEAARELGLVVVMIERPDPPSDESADSPEAAEAWVLSQLA